MSFLAPLMLFGAIAAGIPIALHFFYRSRYRTVPWAAMKFLLASIEQTSRRLRFQELLLLILRTALLIVLALALARPALRLAQGTSHADAVDAVFLIDVSLSMDGRDGTNSRLEQAKQAARTLLEQLPPYSTVQIVAVSDKARLIGPSAPSNLDHARYLIAEIELTHRATDLLPALQEAEAILQRSEAPNKELYIFSDMQKLALERQGAATRAKLRELSERATISFVRCGGPASRNATIIGVQSQSALPHAGEQAAFTVLVKNTGKEIVRDLTVSLELDGQKSESDTAVLSELAVGEVRPVSLTARLPRTAVSRVAQGDRASIVAVSAVVSADGLPADNRFDRLIQVHERIRVLIVDGSPNARVPELAASYFLAHALRPVPEAYWDRYHVQTLVVPAAQISAESLEGVQACFFVDVPLHTDGEQNTPQSEFITRLAEFVRQGGALVVFAGPQVSDGNRRSPAAYNRVLGEEHGLLPVRILGDERTTPDQAAQATRFDPATIPGTSALGRFRSEPLNAIGQVDLIQVLKLGDRRSATGHRPEKSDAPALADGRQPTADSRAEVLLRFNNGEPAIVSREVGQGTVVLVGTTADQRWTDWPVRQTFLPFVHVVFGHCLHGGLRARELRVAEPWACRINANVSALPHVLMGPTAIGNRLSATGDRSEKSEASAFADSRVPIAVEFRSGQPWVAGSDLDHAGLYRVEPARQGKEGASAINATHRLAVTPDLSELENLDAFGDSELDEWLGFAPVHLNAADDVQLSSAGERLRREWTVWVLVLLLVMALGEAVLAWWCGRGW
jgi:hypothetical protein